MSLFRLLLGWSLLLKISLGSALTYIEQDSKVSITENENAEFVNESATELKTETGSSGMPLPIILLIFFIFLSLGLVCMREVFKDWKYHSVLNKLGIDIEGKYSSVKSYGTRKNMNNNNNSNSQISLSIGANSSSLFSNKPNIHRAEQRSLSDNDINYGHLGPLNTIARRLRQYRERQANRPLATESMVFERPNGNPVPAFITPPKSNELQCELKQSSRRPDYYPHEVTPALRNLLTKNLRSPKPKQLARSGLSTPSSTEISISPSHSKSNSNSNSNLNTASYQAIGSPSPFGEEKLEIEIDKKKRRKKRTTFTSHRHGHTHTFAVRKIKQKKKKRSKKSVKAFSDPEPILSPGYLYPGDMTTSSCEDEYEDSDTNLEEDLEEVMSDPVKVSKMIVIDLD